MADTIRKTVFTWDPDHESREAIWNRIKRHIQHELDRIQRETVRRRRIARRLASPSYERNLRIFRESQQGASVSLLARTYSLSPTRVREIVRTETHWSSTIDPSGPEGPHMPMRRPWSSPMLPARSNWVTIDVFRDP